MEMYLGKITITREWALQNSSICMRKIFPRPIPLTLSDKSIELLEEKFNYVFRASGGKLYVKKISSQEKHIVTSFKIEDNPRDFAIIGQHSYHRKTHNGLLCPWTSYQNTITKTSNETVVIFFTKSNPGDWIYAIYIIQ